MRGYRYWFATCIILAVIVLVVFVVAKIANMLGIRIDTFRGILCLLFIVFVVATWK